jgi:hypothetical protein
VQVLIAAPPVQKWLAGQSVQTRLVVLVHWVVSNLPLGHGAVQTDMLVPPLQ